MPELARLALAASMSVPTETRGLVLGSDHNGGMSRHSDLMIARARLRWLGEVRQMSAIGTSRPIDLVLRLFAKDPKADVYGGLTAAFRLQKGQRRLVEGKGSTASLTANRRGLPLHRVIRAGVSGRSETWRSGAESASWADRAGCRISPS